MLVAIIILFIILCMFMIFNGSIGFQKVRFENLFSSLISDMNVDYRDDFISPENIANITKSMDNFVQEVEKASKDIKQLSEEDRKLLSEYITEFIVHLGLWTERHAQEINIYEKSVGSARIFTLMKKRLEIEKMNFQNVVI